MNQYILAEDGKTPVVCEDMHEWGRWMQDAKARKVALTVIPGGRISTIFLGLDHQYGDGPPLLWETMYFEGDSFKDLACERYTTYEEAVIGHAEMVREFTAKQTWIDKLWYRFLDWMRN